MADDTAALVVALSAQLTKFEKDMDNAYVTGDIASEKLTPVKDDRPTLSTLRDRPVFELDQITK